MTSFLRSLSLLSAPMLCLLVAVGCGTAEGGRYDTAPPTGERAPGPAADAPPAPAPAMRQGSGFESAPPRQDYSRGLDTSLDYARDWRSEAYLERQQEQREARDEAREDARERARTISERRAAQQGELRSCAYRDRYDGSQGYPFVDRIVIGGVTYRRIWQSPNYFILDGEPTWDGYGFRYAASSGAQVWQNNVPPRGQRPRTEYERRVYERRYGQPYSSGPAPQPGGWRAGGFNR